jgi:hypothetical protein
MASVLDYYIGKGVVSFKPTGGTYRDMGNAPVFEFTPETEELEHFSARLGTRTNDRTVLLSKSGTVRIVLDEWNMDNLALALLGEAGSDGSGNDQIDIFTESSINGELKFVGANDVGPKYEVIISSVSFRPSSAINFISDEFGQIELSGRASAVDGSFGTLTLLAAGA